MATMQTDEAVYISVDEAAELLRLSPKSVRRMMSSGVLTRHHVGPGGRRVLLDRRQLLDHVRAGGARTAK